MSIDRILQDAYASGFKLNNFFQLDNGRWRASFRDEVFGYAWGEDEFPDRALMFAYGEAKSKRGGLLLTATAFASSEPKTRRDLTSPRPARISADKLLDLI